MALRACALSLAATLLTAAPALAFKEPGHRAIEVAAYRKLLAEADPKTGASVLSVLVDHGVLKPPSRPLPEPSETLDSGYEMLLVESMVAQAHLPDHLMDRQLQADRQCFHFNARGAHFTLTEEKIWGVPKGLVVDAYVECIGVADALLRGILYDPAASLEQSTDIYALVHMIEDSYSDAHVARTGPVGEGHYGDILFVKPWNLRTWLRYFLTSAAEAPVREHFAESHHMGSDTRDLGYLVGPTDEDYEEKRRDPAYSSRVQQCVREARALIRPADRKAATEPLRMEDLYGEVVPPESCLSDRALAARDAVVALLRLVADYVPRVTPPVMGAPPVTPEPSVRHVVPLPDPRGLSFEAAWRNYRKVYLNHRDPALTATMTMPLAGAPIPGAAEADKRANRLVRRDRVYSAKTLAPRQFKDAGFGLGVEVRGSTPLWLGLDTFVSRKSSSHNRTVILFDTLGWGLQLRLPLENEMGERPVGAAFDIGPGLPLPVTELVGLDELQIFVGARLRIAYTAQAIFERETRHAVELGFGGASVDATFGSAWLGLDLARKMYYVDFWDPKANQWSPLTFGLAGGIAIDAL